MTQQPPQSWPPPDAGAAPQPWDDTHHGASSPDPPHHGGGWAATGPSHPTYVDPLTGAPIPGDPPPGSGPVAAGPAPYPAGPYPAAPYPDGFHPAGSYPDTAYAPYPPAGYPPAGYPGPYSAYGWRPPVPTNGLAIASMVLGILWLFWIGSILAVVFGHVARGQIRRSGEGGDGMAVAGIVLGWIGVGLLVLAIVGSAASGTS